VTIATLSIGLNDPFHLDEFDKLRQGLVTALVACAPRQVAP
jgi:telomere length regulation protein